MDQPTSTSPANVDLDAFLGAKPASKRARYLKWGGIAAAALVLLWLLSRFVGGGGAETGYITRPVQRSDLTVTVSATGNLQPINQVDVGSELSGLVTQVFVDNNYRVARGQELARLDTSRLRDSIAQSRAALLSAEANVAQQRATAAQSRATLARYQEVYRLSGGKVPSGTELDAARADYARAQASVRAAEAAVAQARAQLSSDQTQLSKASIRSPVTGVVLSRKVEPGQTVAASFNAPVLFTIAEDLSQMQLEAKVDEADVGEVKEGQRANFTVDAFPGRQFPATVQRVDVGANASGSTSSSTSTSTAASSVVAYTAVLAVANPELILRPGMTATADIVTSQRRNVMLVPNAALRFSPDRQARSGQRGGVTSVLMPPRRGMGRSNRGDRQVEIGRGSRQTLYVLGDDGQPKPIRVTVGESNGSQTEVTGRGLRPGMQIIVGRRSADPQ